MRAAWKLGMKAAKGLWIVAGYFFALVFASAAQTLTIAPAVEVTFDTVTNHYYRVEMASSLATNQWKAISPTLWGRGTPLKQSVKVGDSAQFFRVREYDLTNQLIGYFPFDGSSYNEVGVFSGSIFAYGFATGFTTSRFGTPHHAAVVGASYGFYYPVRASLQRFAISTNDFTISVWMANPFLPRWAGDQPPFGDLISTHSYNLALMATNADGSIELFLGGKTNSVLKSQPLNWEPNRWYYFVLERERGVFSVYRDLELIGQARSSRALNPDPLRIIIDIFFGWPDTKVDDATFYNRALSFDELVAVSEVTER
jgi:hypothetical protein